MRRLAAVGITTREACGNSVRNVTACPLRRRVQRPRRFDVIAVCERHDVLPARPRRHAGASGARFKIAFSGCKTNALRPRAISTTSAASRPRARSTARCKRGFEVYVGGGLGAGAVARPQLLDRVLPEEELFPLHAGGVPRVRAARREATTARARASSSWSRSSASKSSSAWSLEERTKLRPDERWTQFLADLALTDEDAAQAAERAPRRPRRAGFDAWRQHATSQPQAPGRLLDRHRDQLPLGDFTPAPRPRRRRHRCASYTGDTLRTTVDQNLAVPLGLRTATFPRALRRASSPSAWPTRAPTPSPTSRRAPAPTPASSASRRRAASRASCAASAKVLVENELGARSARAAHQVQRLLQLLRPAPHRRSRVPGREPQRQRPARAALSARRSAASCSATRRRTASAIGAIPSEERAQGRGSDSRTATSRASRRGETFKAWVDRVGKKAVRKLVDDLTQVPTLRAGSELLLGLGRPARVHHRRPWASASARARSCRWSSSASPPASARCSRLRCCSTRASRATRRREPSAPCWWRRARLTRQKNQNLSDQADEIVREFRHALRGHEAVLGSPTRTASSRSTSSRRYEEPSKNPTERHRAPAGRRGAAVRGRGVPVLHQDRQPDGHRGPRRFATAA